MGNITDKTWWAAAGIRALKTVCQTAIGTIGTAAFIEQVDWKIVLSSSLLAGLLSLLTSLKGLPELNSENTEEPADAQE